MGGFFRAGEEKIRPGVYHRYTNTTVKQVSYDGVVADLTGDRLNSL